MKKLQTILAIIGIALCAVSCSEDVVSTFGSVYGIVTDAETGEPLRNVSITLSPGNETTVTGNDGHYEFADLEAGLYKLQFSLYGYATTSRQVTVVAGKRCTADAVLSHSNSPGGGNDDTGGGNDDTGDNGGDKGAASVGLNVKELDFGDSETEMSFNLYNLEDATADLVWEIDPELHKCLTVSPMSGTLPAGYYNTIKVTLNRATMTSDIDTSIDIYDLNVDVYYYRIPVKAKYKAQAPQEDYSSATVQSCDSRIVAEIESCKRSGNNVVFTYRLTNEGMGYIRQWRIYPTNALSVMSGCYRSTVADNLGNEYFYSLFEFRNQRNKENVIQVEFPDDMTCKGSVTVYNVDEQASTLTIMLGVATYNHSTTLGDNRIYFKNVPIY